MNRGSGKEMPEVARMMGATPEEAFLRLLVDDHLQVNMVIYSQCEEDMRGLLQHPLALVITDGLAFAPYGPLGRGRPHPRSYGTFPRFLGRYVRDEGLHSLEEGIRRVTSGPAARMGITDRGILREGLAAAIVVFDPGAIRDTATYTGRPVSRIDLVVVNGGRPSGEEHTGLRQVPAIARGAGSQHGPSSHSLQAGAVTLHRAITPGRSGHQPAGWTPSAKGGWRCRRGKEAIQGTRPYPRMAAGDGRSVATRSGAGSTNGPAR